MVYYVLLCIVRRRLVRTACLSELYSSLYACYLMYCL